MITAAAIAEWQQEFATRAFESLQGGETHRACSILLEAYHQTVGRGLTPDLVIQMAALDCLHADCSEPEYLPGRMMLIYSEMPSLTSILQNYCWSRGRGDLSHLCGGDLVKAASPLRMAARETALDTVYAIMLGHEQGDLLHAELAPLDPKDRETLAAVLTIHVEHDAGKRPDWRTEHLESVPVAAILRETQKKMIQLAGNRVPASHPPFFAPQFEQEHRGLQGLARWRGSLPAIASSGEIERNR